MKKNLLMLLGLGALFAVGNACFSPSTKVDKTSPAYTSTNQPAVSK